MTQDRRSHRASGVGSRLLPANWRVRPRLVALIRADMVELASTYSSPRRTEITADADEVRMEDLIADEQVAVTISHEGYVKRLLLTEYRLQGRGARA